MATLRRGIATASHPAAEPSLTWPMTFEAKPMMWPPRRARRQCVHTATQRRQLNLVNPIPPRIPLRELRLVQPGFELQLNSSPPANRPISIRESSISRIISPGNTCKIRPQHPIILILIPECWRVCWKVVAGRCWNGVEGFC
jgi:hypothetical protein